MSFTLCGLMLLTILGAQATSAKPRFAFECHENGKGKFAANSTYKTNLKQALSRLVQSSHDLNGSFGFYESSFGRNPNIVYMTGLCRGDLEPGLCNTCLENSTNRLRKVCPNEREAIGGFEECVVRYSEGSSVGLTMETHTRAYYWNNDDQSSVPYEYSDTFFRDLMKLLNELRDRASRGGPLGKYSTGNTTTGLNLGFIQTIYAVAQCTPVLSEMECGNCLDEVFEDVRRFHRMLGWRVITPSCNFRFEVYKFYGQPDNLDNSAPPPLTYTKVLSRKNKVNAYGTSGLAVTSASVVLIIAVGVYTRVKKTNTKAQNDDASSGDVEEIGSVGYLKFDLSAIKVATNNFSEQKKIGHGTVSVVYKGTLDNGQDVAVKRVDITRSHRVYLKNEILCGSKLFHRNLVRLFGFCSKGDTNYLIYEFLPKKLDRLLFDKSIDLNWETRYKIINGIARALLYLHEDSGLAIAHGDIRSSKILLDEKLSPKISCFGSAHKFVTDLRSDVFSFGVLILEIVRRQASEPHSESFLSHARRNCREGAILNLVDPRIIGDSDSESLIIRCIQIALLCIQVEADSRPTMSSVVLMLNLNSLITLPDIQTKSEEASSLPVDIESNKSLSSSNSFVSATKASLSPISEKGHHEAELVDHLNHSSRSSNFRGSGSLWRKLFFP